MTATEQLYERNETLMATVAKLQQTVAQVEKENDRLRQMLGHIAPEPAPTPTDGERVVDAVIRDMSRRAKISAESYGTYLQTGNGRRAMVDAYQELLDLTVYIKQWLMENGQ